MAGPRDHGSRRDDLAEHAGELVAVSVMNANETEPRSGIEDIVVAATAQARGDLSCPSAAAPRQIQQVDRGVTKPSDEARRGAPKWRPSVGEVSWGPDPRLFRSDAFSFDAIGDAVADRFVDVAPILERT